MKAMQRLSYVVNKKVKITLPNSNSQREKNSQVGEKSKKTEENLRNVSSNDMQTVHKKST